MLNCRATCRGADKKPHDNKNVSCGYNRQVEQRQTGGGTGKGKTSMKKWLKCKICGQEFYPVNSKQQCCCHECGRENNRRLARTYHQPKRPKIPTIKKCEMCGFEFATSNPYQKFCSRKCKKMHDVAEQRLKRHGTTKTARECKVCGREFEPKHSAEKCCSEACRVINKARIAEGWRRVHGKTRQPKFELTPAQIEQRERLKLELLRRRLLREGVYQ